MPTTIKVSNDLRDRLKAQAAEHGRTIGEHLGVLADDADRRARFARLRAQIAATPAELRASYLDEVRTWDATSSDGILSEEFRDWPGYATA